ncbi:MULTISPECIES: peptide-methionine (S)-S-oxide reductase MsrA [unclassified Guyparkeria]|uniref:peptide-methionine (S)-S-oxide reductase MsrA n=1 Tax=unclassified Guyparkeria TaxID=2626246 RepID=UPI0007333DEB|nr:MULTISPECIES: peptide-methionine (S)-S-oxide reductase MsrA [unclassified Guyparkeria]KTG16095.1 methionine sulfoxide reductase A [Guyparkeria sp. XI15]OAE84946.1 methionine sulfoxide reductase A [Guyparkeria sp. WRN-7]
MSQATEATTTNRATFAAGCFWGVEDRFRQLPGVIEAISGYTGGHVDHPDYRQVCTGTTGHAEAVEVRFDPAEIDYEDLVRAFFAMHDPTTPNRQGPDVGTQYRSAIFVHDRTQRETAERVRSEQENQMSRPIVTEITDAGTFWPAEDYHQRYLEKRRAGVL